MRPIPYNLARRMHSRARRFSRRAAAVIALATLAILPAAEAMASSPPESAPPPPPGFQRELDDLRQMLEALAAEQNREIQELRQRVADLEAQLQQARAARETEELDDLRAEVEMATAEQAELERTVEPQRKTFVGRQRSLQALNPEISFLGDVSYDWGDADDFTDQYFLRGVEISFQASLDPYTRFRGTLAAHQEPTEFEHDHEADEDGHGDHHITVGIEEAYLEWVALPLHTRLSVGQFRQQFGTLNRWHPHALPSVDMPFALRNIFGHEGLVGLGVGVDWQLPGLWATSNTLQVEVVNADNDVAFAGSHFDDPSYLLRHTGFFDLGPDTYLELGLTGLTGPNDETDRSDTDIAGLDVNFVWEPVERARYRGVEARGEYIRTWYEAGGDAEYQSSSMYLYLTTKLSRRWKVGVRYDDAELPWPGVGLHEEDEFTEGLREKAWSPYVTFWQSEFVRLRFQYQHASRDFHGSHGGDDDDRFWLQVTFAAGPHKHEAY